MELIFQFGISSSCREHKMSLATAEMASLSVTFCDVSNFGMIFMTLGYIPK